MRLFMFVMALVYGSFGAGYALADQMLAMKSGVIVCDTKQQVRDLTDWGVQNPHAKDVDWDAHPGCGRMQFPPPYNVIGMPTIISAEETYTRPPVVVGIAKLTFQSITGANRVQYGYRIISRQYRSSHI